MSSLSEMNIKAVLGERLDLSVPPKIVHNADGTKERVVQTQSGKELHAGLVVRHHSVHLRIPLKSVPCTAVVHRTTPQHRPPAGGDPGRHHR